MIGETMQNKYLKLLSAKYSNIQEVATEIINLQAILNLPKGTEHFLSDLHGEHEAFMHITKNASGSIKTKIDQIFGKTVADKERQALATLVYYPEEKLSLIRKNGENSQDWYRITLYRLVEICRLAASKYTRSKVRKALPPEFAYIIDELLNTNNDYNQNREQYYEKIIATIISLGRADAFITALSHLIQRLIIDRLHIIGDIFDRGPGAHIIMERLREYHSVDIEWGNHDILWMGAAAGQDACIAAVLANSIKYNNFDTLEDGYGISLRPLVTYALDVYANDPCTPFIPKSVQDDIAEDSTVAAKIHKAIAIIQFKLEGQTILRRPEYRMNHRLSLSEIDFSRGLITIDGSEYRLRDTNFPTVNPSDPYALTDEESALVEKLRLSFLHSDTLQRHVKFLYKNGGMYLKCNSNLLYHGCIPMEADGSFSTVELYGKNLSGKAYVDYAEKLARQAYFSGDAQKKFRGADFMWYLWCGAKSPLNGKNKISTFERYFIEDKAAWEEHKDPYYTFINDEATVRKILAEFDLDENKGKIINGHMPVKIIKGESPVRANGRLLVIDGGMSKAYQPVTGIAGYTLISNSNEMILSAHEPFVSAEKAISQEIDMHSHPSPIERFESRVLIKDTDTGKILQDEIRDLEMLLEAYKAGTIKQ